MSELNTVVDSFWRQDEDVPAPATDALIAAAEQSLGVRLPALLCRLLRRQNGGSVSEQWNAFRLREPTEDEDWAPLSQLMGIDPDADLSILDTGYLIEEWELPSPVVLLDGDGHRWVALDYRDSGPLGQPSVAYFDADEGTSQLVAPDFDTFLESLVPDSTFDTDAFDPAG